MGLFRDGKTWYGSCTLGNTNLESVSHSPTVTDEAHKAKNLIPDNVAKPTKTGMAVLMLQQALPSAHVIYSSATGATNASHLGYMIRLGTYGFKDMGEMCKKLESARFSGLELYARGIKATGSYVSRSLSYRGAEFVIDEIELDREMEVIYDRCVIDNMIFVVLCSVLHAVCCMKTPCMELSPLGITQTHHTTPNNPTKQLHTTPHHSRATHFWTLLCILLTNLKEEVFFWERTNKIRKMLPGVFWGAHQRFFSLMLMSAKVPACARIAREALAEGHSVVIGLQSTGKMCIRGWCFVCACIEC